MRKDKEGKVKDTQVNRKLMKKKAWVVFSEWIRKRDRQCVTCGKAYWEQELGEWTIKGLQAGHFHHNVLDFDEENVNCQCSQCNHYMSGNLAKYSIYLLDRLGKKKFMDLGIRAKMALKGELKSVEDYQKIIERYK